MLLALKHKNLDSYKVAQQLVKECYKVTTLFPLEERYALTQQIRRASLSVKLNLTEGASRKSVIERNRYYEIARGSVIEIDTAVESAIDLLYVQEKDILLLSTLLNRSFALLSKMIQ